MNEAEVMIRRLGEGRKRKFDDHAFGMIHDSLHDRVDRAKRQHKEKGSVIPNFICLRALF